MALYQNYPYTDLQTLNLDYILQGIKTLTVDAQTAANNIEELQNNVTTLDARLTDLEISEASKYFEVPQTYGAVGDGVHNDTQAVQAALDASNTNGKPVYIPAGSYYCPDILFHADNEHINHSLRYYANQMIFGAKGKAKLIAGAQSAHFLAPYNADNATGYTGIENVYIFGLELVGLASAPAQCLLTTSHCTNIIIDSVTFTGGAQFHQIEYNSTKQGIIVNCRFGPMYNRTYNTECVQLDSAIGSGNHGADDNTPCDQNIISNCIFHDLNCVAIGNHNNNANRNTLIVGCTFEQTQLPVDNRSIIHFSPGVFVTVSACSFIGVDDSVKAIIANRGIASGCSYNGAGIPDSLAQTNAYDMANGELYSVLGKFFSDMNDLSDKLGSIRLQSYPQSATNKPSTFGGVAIKTKAWEAGGADLAIDRKARAFVQSYADADGTPQGWHELFRIIQIGNGDINNYVANQPAGSVVAWAYDNGATNTPVVGGGVCISAKNPGDGRYGAQLVLSNNGVFTRLYSAGTFQPWKQHNP